MHKNVSGAKTYLPTLTRLVQKHHCIALDLPDLGGSFEPPEIDSISRLQEYTLEFIDALGFDEFHTFGNHTGAAMAAEIASLYPDRVKSCIMMGSTLLTE